MVKIVSEFWYFGALLYFRGGKKKEKLSETARVHETWESDAWELNEANHDFSLFLIFYFIFLFFLFI